jgi:8-oxo-dGTP diphosphatase
MQNAIHVLSRAVIIKNEKILMCVNSRFSFYFLPGGHIEHGESAAFALERELQEELGLVCTAQRFLGCFEYSFIPTNPDKCHSHEYNFIYMVDAPELTEEVVPHSPEDHTLFSWVPLAALPEVDFKPSALKGPLITWLDTDYDGAFITCLEKK